MQEEHHNCVREVCPSVVHVRRPSIRMPCQSGRRRQRAPFGIPGQGASSAHGDRETFAVCDDTQQPLTDAEDSDLLQVNKSCLSRSPHLSSLCVSECVFVCVCVCSYHVHNTMITNNAQFILGEASIQVSRRLSLVRQSDLQGVS